MTYRLLTLNDSAEWRNLLENLPTEFNDIYLSPDFFSCFRNTTEEPRCFVYKESDDYALYPFLFTEINEPHLLLGERYYDVQAPYGYNGMVCTSKNQSFLERFAAAFQDFCQNENVVAELVRFNPVLKNETFMRHLGTTNVLDNVAIDLTPGYSSIWTDGFEGKVRKAVRKAASNNLSFEYYRCRELPDEKLTSFKKLYLDTMRRNNARDYYYFNDAFYNKLPRALPDNSIIAFVYHAGIPVSTQLVLFKGNVAYGYLGGTSADAFSVSPNVYLFHRLIATLCELGFEVYSIGGGITRGDSLYHYKKSFSRNTPDGAIYLGSTIHNKPIYENVVAQWKQKFPQLERRYENYILKYRYTS